MPNFQAPSAVIIIDLWSHGPGPSSSEAVEPILEFIQQDFVKCIVVASYTDWGIHGTRATPIEWPIWHNSQRIFTPTINPHVPDYVGRSWQSYEHAHTPLPPPDQLQHQFVTLDQPVTEPTLLKKLSCIGTPSFAAWEIDQLTYLLNSHYPEIENIYLCGGSFDQCLQNRPLGLKALQHAISRTVFKNVRLLLMPTQCVFNGKDITFPEEVQANPHLLEPNWMHIPDQQLVVVQHRSDREYAISAAVRAAALQPISSTAAVTLDAEHLLAVEAARLDSRRRRGLL
jgi:hypothetical protein